MIVWYGAAFSFREMVIVWLLLFSLVLSLYLSIFFKGFFFFAFLR